MVSGITMLYVKTMVCGFAINSLEINLILQPARSDIKSGPALAYGNRLLVENKKFSIY